MQGLRTNSLMEPWQTRVTNIAKASFTDCLKSPVSKIPFTPTSGMKPQGRYYSLVSPQASAAVETSHRPSPTAATLFHPDFELVPAVPSVPSALRSPEPAGRARFLKPAGPAPGPVRCGSGALCRRTWLKAGKEGVYEHTEENCPNHSTQSVPNTSWDPSFQSFSSHKPSLLILLSSLSRDRYHKLKEVLSISVLISVPPPKFFLGSFSKSNKSCLHTFLLSLMSHLQMNPQCCRNTCDCFSSNILPSASFKHKLSQENHLLRSSVSVS